MELGKIKDPGFLKGLKEDELHEVSDALREHMISYVGRNGGYLADNLSAADLAVSLYRIFDNNDKIIFSKELSYASEMLNGNMDDLNSYGDDDPFASALGIALSRDIDRSDRHVVLVMNSVDFDKGSNIELLNQLCSMNIRLIIVCNDDNNNERVNLLDRFINVARNTASYHTLKRTIRNTIRPIKYGDVIIDNLHKAKDSIKKKIVDEGMFSTYSIDYIGPVDGHNFKDIENALDLAKQKVNPVIVHCITRSGKGYRYADNDRTGYYRRIESFDIKTGKLFNEENDECCRISTLLADKIGDLMKNNKDICIISDDFNADGTAELFSKYPERTQLLNISARNRLDIAVSMCREGKIPYLTLNNGILNSSDSIKTLENINKPMFINCICSENAPEFIRMMKNVYICTVYDDDQLIEILNKTLDSDKPAIILDDRKTIEHKSDEKTDKEVGKWSYLVNNKTKDVAIFAYGKDLMMIRRLIEENEFKYSLIDCSIINHVDEQLFKDAARSYKNLYFYGDLFDFIVDKASYRNVKVLKNEGINVLFDTIAGDLDA